MVAARVAARMRVYAEKAWRPAKTYRVAGWLEPTVVNQ